MPTRAKLKPLRDFFQRQHDLLSGLITHYQSDEFISGQLTEVRKSFKDTLSNLPADGGDTEVTADELFPVLCQDQLAIGTLTTTLNTLQGRQQDLNARIAAGVKSGLDAEIKRRADAGELITPTRHEELCSAARTAAATEKETELNAAFQTERESWQAQRQLMDTRRQDLLSKKLPVPDDKTLGLPEEDWKKAHTTAQERVKKLTGKGFTLESEIVTSLAWLDEASYASNEKLVLAAVQGRTPGSRIEPFARPPEGDSGERKTVGCL